MNMGIITKNIPKAEQDLSNVPEGLQIRRNNAIKAKYNFAFDEKEKKYIAYNKLRSERPDKERVQVAKVYRLKDRDSDKEFLVWYQTSRTEDYEGNLVKCPHVEKIGVEDKPKTTVQKNSQNQITDIQLVETENDFYVPFSEEKIKEIFNKSRNSQNITCYIGYCKPVQEIGTDYMTEKKRINDQIAFMSDDFDELMQLSSKNNRINTYSKADKNKSKKTNVNEEEDDDDTPKKRQSKNKKRESKKEDDEKDRIGKLLNKYESETNDADNKLISEEEYVNNNNVSEVDSEDNDDNDEETPTGHNGKLKIGSLD